MANINVNLDLHGTRDGPPGVPFLVISRRQRIVANMNGTIKIQAFQIPISKAGIADVIQLLFIIFGGQYLRYKLIIGLVAFILKNTLTLDASFITI